MLLRSLVNNWMREAASQALQDAVATAARSQTDGDAESPPPPPCQVAVVFALSIEAGGLVDLLSQATTTRFQTHVEHAGQLAGRQVVIAESGIGRQAAARVTNDVISLHKPPWLISAGFAGALHPDLRRGHVLMADEVLDPAGHCVSIGLPVDREAAAGSKALHIGRLLTVDHLVKTKQEREQLRSTYEALACDMETLAVAEACANHAARFLSVRVISDAVGDELPREIESMLDQRSLAGKLGAATGAIFKRPSSVKDMWNLKEEALKASDRLARFLTGVIEQQPA